MSIDLINQTQHGQQVISVTPKAQQEKEQSADASEIKARTGSLSQKIQSTNKEDEINLDRLQKDRSESEEDEDIEEIVKKVNEKINANQMVQRELEFSIDDESKKTVIKVMDKKTEEVIRQIPSEQLLELERALNKGEPVKGLLVKVVA